MKRGTTYRCSACGLIRHAIVFQGDREKTPMACPEHPEAPLIEWSATLTHAYTAIMWATLSLAFDPDADLGDGDRVEEFVKTFDPAYWPGIETGAMALAAAFWKRWGRQDLPERRLPERGKPASPAGLFGPKVRP